MNPWRKLSAYEFLVPEEVLINLTRVVDTKDDLTEDELRYLNTRIKPKEVIIIIFMLLLWLFSIHRYTVKYILGPEKGFSGSEKHIPYHITIIYTIPH